MGLGYTVPEGPWLNFLGPDEGRLTLRQRRTPDRSGFAADQLPPICYPCNSNTNDKEERMKIDWAYLRKG